MVGVDNESGVDILTQVLDDLQADLIDVTEAARRVTILEEEPEKYHCGTCRFFKSGECWMPGQPSHIEHAMSTRCGNYEGRDPRSEALPVEKPTGSRMWK